ERPDPSFRPRKRLLNLRVQFTIAPRRKVANAVLDVLRRVAKFTELELHLSEEPGGVVGLPEPEGCLEGALRLLVAFGVEGGQPLREQVSSASGGRIFR